MQKKRWIEVVFILLCFALFGCGKTEKEEKGTQKDLSLPDAQPSEEPTLTQDALKQYQFRLPQQGDTVAEFVISDFGSIFVKLFPEDAPLAVENFVTHAKEGYYDETSFHRIIDDFMIQGGIPKESSNGGESIWKEAFEDEFSKQLNPFRGALCMANHGANTNGSQFFLVQADANSIMELKYLLEEGQDMTLQDYLENQYGILLSDKLIEQYITYGGTPWLTGYHTVFGQIFEGFDVLDKIAAVPVFGDQPLEPVVIETIRIIQWEVSTE